MLSSIAGRRLIKLLIETSNILPSKPAVYYLETN